MCVVGGGVWLGLKGVVVVVVRWHFRLAFRAYITRPVSWIMQASIAAKR